MCTLICLCYDVIITHHKIDNFCDFSSDINFNSKTDVFRDAIYLIIDHCEPRRPEGAPPADIRCPLSVQRKQAKRACIYINIH